MEILKILTTELFNLIPDLGHIKVVMLMLSCYNTELINNKISNKLTIKII